jgi:C-terminal processing protease CtpA/Prc
VASTFVSAGGRNVGLLKVPSFSTETASQIVDGLRSVATGGGGTGDGSVVVDAIAIDIRGNGRFGQAVPTRRPLQVAPAK